MSEITYKIDGTDIKTLGVRVSASSGVVDGLKMKDPLVSDWPDYHGQSVDLSTPRYEARTIILDCWCEGTGRVDFITKVNGLLALLDTPGLHRLEIGLDAASPLVFEVYRLAAMAVTKQWSTAEMVGTFHLTLVEPDPVKKVLKYSRTSDADKTLSITFESDYNVNIFWGDGDTTLNQEEGTVTHDFAANGDYIIIIAGVISDFTGFSTTGTVIWEQL